MTTWVNVGKLNAIADDILAAPFGGSPVYCEYQYAKKWDNRFNRPIKDGGTSRKTSDHYVGVISALLFDMDQQIEDGNDDITYGHMLRAVRFYHLCLGSYTYNMNLKNAYVNLGISDLKNRFSLDTKPYERRWK